MNRKYLYCIIMKSEIQSRKSFLKKLGVVVGAGAFAPVAAASGTAYTTDTTLDEEQQEFLTVYEKWLDEFHSIIKLQNSGDKSESTRKKLMELTSKAESWRRQLEVHMLNADFAQHYNQITMAITNDIV